MNGPVPRVSTAAAVFPAQERWGWEYHEPDTIVAPFPDPEPVVNAPTPPDPPLRPILARPDVRMTAWGLLAFAVSCAVLAGLPTGDRHPVGTDRIILTLTPILVVLLVIIGIGALVLGRAAEAHYLASVAYAHADWMRRCAAARSRYQERYDAWHQARRTHQHTERERLRTESPWRPTAPVATWRRTDVYGGTPDGWAAWLTVTCGALIGSGVHVTVLDLSRSGAATRLATVARIAGRPLHVVTLSGQWHDVDLFGDRPAEQVAHMVCEAMHATERESTVAARSLDLRVLTNVCQALDAPLTIQRIAAALQVLQYDQPPPADDREPLSLAEYDRITTRYGDTLRQQVQPRITALEALLHPVAGLGARPRTEEPSTLPAAHRPLRIITLARRLPDLTRELVTQLLIQTALADLHDSRRDTTPSPVLVVVGADMTPNKQLTTLTELARDQGTRLIYLFQHLRNETADLLGDADTVFLMRIGNATEAAQAAEFIGREHRFVLHQHSYTTARQDGVTGGANHSIGLTHGANHGLAGGGTNVSMTDQRGTSEGWATNSTTTQGSNDQRVYEFTVEPGVLQRLPETAFVVVQAEAPGDRRARFGDCDPGIALDQHTDNGHE